MGGSDYESYGKNQKDHSGDRPLAGDHRRRAVFGAGVCYAGDTGLGVLPQLRRAEAGVFTPSGQDRVKKNQRAGDLPAR